MQACLALLLLAFLDPEPVAQNVEQSSSEHAWAHLASSAESLVHRHPIHQALTHSVPWAWNAPRPDLAGLSSPPILIPPLPFYLTASSLLVMRLSPYPHLPLGLAPREQGQVPYPPKHSRTQYGAGSTWPLRVC